MLKMLSYSNLNRYWQKNSTSQWPIKHAFYTFGDALFNFLSVLLPSLLSFVQLLEFNILQLSVIKPISLSLTQLYSFGEGWEDFAIPPPFVEQAWSDRGKGPPRKAVYSLSLLFLCNWSHSTSMGGRLQRHAAVGGRSACARGLVGQKTTASRTLTTHTFDECGKLHTMRRDVNRVFGGNATLCIYAVIKLTRPIITFLSGHILHNKQ